MSWARRARRAPALCRWPSAPGAGQPRGLGTTAASSEGRKINLNADLAEGFGPWTMTADAELMEIVGSANVACGGHAGDASIMGSALERAATTGVSVGSHPGYDDKPGFGRRVIPLTPSEVEELVAYQTGALVGVAGLVRARRQVRISLQWGNTGRAALRVA